MSENNHCACHFDEDGETVLKWCLVHAQMRDRIKELEAERDALKELLEPFTRLPVPSTPMLIRYCTKAREAQNDD